MDKYRDIILKCPLFTDIEEFELPKLLECLSATERCFEKNSFVFLEEEKITLIGVILSGSVHVIQEDFWGNRTILARIAQGDLFGGAYFCAEKNKLPVSVYAAEETVALFIDCKKFITLCPSPCIFHIKLIKNMLKILATKNVMLTQKIEFLTQHTTRDKLMSYLSAQALQAGSTSFEIPFNRQELAEYLSIDRSAMSKELSKMRDDGILTYKRNRFELLKS